MPVLTTIVGVRVEAFVQLATVSLPGMATVLSGGHCGCSHTMLSAVAGSSPTLNICWIETAKLQVKEESSDTLLMNSTLLLTLIVTHTVVWVRELFSIGNTCTGRSIRQVLTLCGCLGQ